jgi:hypothetical protein
MSLRAGLNQNKDKYAFLHVSEPAEMLCSGRDLIYLRSLLTVGGSSQLCRWFRSRVSQVSFAWIYMNQVAEASLYVILEHLVSQHDQISVLLEKVLVQRS